MFIILVLVSLLNLAVAQEAPPRVQVLIDQFNSVMTRCPERVWNNYSWRNSKIVLITPDKEESWVWDADSQSVKKLKNEYLPSSSLKSFYEFFNLDNKKAISILLEEKESTKSLMGLAVHEFFHNIVQEKWDIKQTSRGTIYPFSYEPRYFRRMIFDELKSYLLTGDIERLEKANTWFKKWRHEYSDEFNSSTDGYEGSAEYVETIVTSLIQAGGCSATEEKLKQVVTDEVKNEFGSAFNGEVFMLDSEGYQLGALASIILRFENVDTDWQKKIALGRSPLELLFDNVKESYEREPNKLLENSFKKSAEKKNKEIKDLLGSNPAALDDKNFVRVYLPFEWLQTNFMPAHMILMKSNSGILSAYPLATDHEFKSKEFKGYIKVKENSVIFTEGEKFSKTACESPLFVLVHKNNLKIVASGFKFSALNISGQVEGQLQTQEDSFLELCIQ